MTDNEKLDRTRGKMFSSLETKNVEICTSLVWFCHMFCSVAAVYFPTRGKSASVDIYFAWHIISKHNSKLERVLKSATDVV
jgi:hypothetical protein